MWEHQCMAKRVKGGRCTRESRYGVHTYWFQAERFDGPTWVETCAHHWHLAQPGISTIDIHRRTK